MEFGHRHARHRRRKLQRDVDGAQRQRPAVRDVVLEQAERRERVLLRAVRRALDVDAEDLARQVGQPTSRPPQLSAAVSTVNAAGCLSRRYLRSLETEWPTSTRPSRSVFTFACTESKDGASSRSPCRNPE